MRSSAKYSTGSGKAEGQRAEGGGAEGGWREEAGTTVQARVRCTTHCMQRALQCTAVGAVHTHSGGGMHTRAHTRTRTHARTHAVLARARNSRAPRRRTKELAVVLHGGAVQRVQHRVAGAVGGARAAVGLAARGAGGGSGGASSRGSSSRGSGSSAQRRARSGGKRAAAAAASFNATVDATHCRCNAADAASAHAALPAAPRAATRLAALAKVQRLAAKRALVDLACHTQAASQSALRSRYVGVVECVAGGRRARRAQSTARVNQRASCSTGAAAAGAAPRPALLRRCMRAAVARIGGSPADAAAPVPHRLPCG